MRLLSAELWHWQGLGHVVLDDLSPRLNVVLAPNESGKSRVVRALRFALFESHRGAASHKKAVQSWGRAEAPRVAVRFEAGGVAYRLEKQFLKAPHALLEGGGETLRDQDAEDRLSELLGLDGAQARKADAGQLGLWPLLWVEQFTSSRAPHDFLNEPSRARLQDLLSEEIGEIAAGAAGERVLRRAREEAARWWTPASWRETGELRKAREAWEAAERACAAALETRAKLAGVSDRLAEVDAEAAELARRLEARRRALAEADARAASAREARSRAEAQVAAVELARARRHAAERDLGLRGEREAAAAERRADVGRAREELAGAEGRVGERGRALEEAQARVASAEEGAAAARAGLRRALRRAERSAALERSKELGARFARLVQLRAELKGVAEALAGIAVSRESLERLRGVASARERASARLEGASARLTVRAHRDLETAEGPLPAGTERSWVCSGPRTVTLVGLADVVVVPGGEGLADLRAEAARLDAEWVELLASAGVATLADAAARLEERQRLEAQAKAANAELKRVCPEGESVLEASAAKAAKVLDELWPDELEPEEPGVPAVAEAQAVVESAEERLREARSERDAVADALGRLREAAAEGRSRVANGEAEAERLEALLAAMPPRAALEEAASAAAGAWEGAVGVEKDLRRRYAEAGGDQAASDAERERGAWAQLDEARRKLAEERVELSGQLKAFRAEALHERAQEAEGDLVEARRRLDDARRNAAAARRLLEGLEAARRVVQDRLTAPVVERVQPYLEQLFPGSRLSLSERWDVVGLDTGDTPEPFEELSGGAREQLGVLVRLALGEVFAGDDRLPLLLDDALVHSDPGRLAAMHRILYEASKKLQVLVFSCHEEAFDGLGAERRYTLPRGRARA